MRARLTVAALALASAYGCASGVELGSAVEIPVPAPTLATNAAIANLSSADSNVRAQAAWQLAGATELQTEARQALEPLQADPDRTVRYAVAWALGHLRGSLEGSGAEPGMSPAKLVHSVHPQYPASAFARKIQGLVLLEVLIGEEGEVAHAEIRRSIPDLDAAALDCIRRWRFEPARVDGVPRAIVARAPVVFRIF